MIKPVRWRTRWDLIPEGAIRDIHNTSLQILERTGLLMPLSPQRQGQAADLGLRVERETNRIRFPPELVEAALRTAPKQYTLCARDPADDLLLDGLHGYLCLDGCGTQTLDLETRELRNSTKADLQAAARLADALPQIAFLWPAVSAQDCPPRVQPLHELEALLTNSGKHVQAMTAVDELNARGTLEMAAEVAGGSAALRSRPLVSGLLCSVSPLAYHKDALEAAFLYGQAGIPTGFMSMSISCATAPATLAGSAALVNAEVLAGIVLLQAFFPGLPTYYGSCATMLELTTGGITAGGPEDFLLQAAACQMAHHYGLPANVGTFATGAKTSGWQAGLENALSGAVSQASGADMMCGAGQLYGARIFSFEQLLMDCEIYDVICALMQGFEVDEETLALDLIESIGPQNNFLATRHTRTHMHDVWQPAIIDRSAWADWVQRGRPAPFDAAHAVAARFFAGGEPSPRELRQQTLRALSSYEPEPPSFAGRLREIVSEYEKM